MSKKSLFTSQYALVPLVLSGLLCLVLSYFFWQGSINDPTFTASVVANTTLLITLSGVIAILILAYIFYAVFNAQRSKFAATIKLAALVKKMNIVREIIEILIESKMWLPGLKDFIEEEYENLTFFEVKEFYKGKSKVAIEFLQEKRNYADTETLYLELKSLLLLDPKHKKKSKTSTHPTHFKKEVIEKWMEHKVGSGLWYYFGYKYGTYKDALDIEAIFDRHQDKMITLANNIDSDVFEDSSFNEVFLSKLGEYINKNLIPQLLQAQSQVVTSVSKLLKIVYSIFASVILIGVLIPLIVLLFNFPGIIIMACFSVIISILFFIVITILPFLKNQMQP